jgi:small subunit ribosomal protein S1
VSEPEEDFAAMFAASQQAKQFQKGQTIEGTIVAIGPAVAFVDVGGKGEAVVDIAELKDRDGIIEVSVGDRIHATVVSTVGGLTLSRRLARGHVTDQQLTDAFHSGLPVEGKIERTVKGGYEVRLARQRAFCPFSQIDITRTADPEAHVGRVYAFRIIEYKEGGRNLIVSRRKVLEEEQQEHAAELRRTIVPGAIVPGRVVSVRDFGAFVDLGAGIQGLLHVSEIGWSRVSDPSEMLKPGDEITVKVLRVDDGTQKIALGLKQLTEDPWSTAAAKFVVGQVYKGRVARQAKFGVFVELAPGIDALMPNSESGVAKEGDVARAFTAGSAVDVVVLDVDPEARRIRVSRKAINDAQDAEELRDYTARSPAPGEGFSPLADKLRGALDPRRK